MNNQEWVLPHRDTPGVHPTFRRDGKATIDPHYELYGSTRTVGGLRAALEKVRSGQREPADYEAYLHQRVPSISALADAPDNAEIDDFGRVVPWPQ